ncbi:hypothetical protein Ddc_06402 [Ditylenchus destructor]|nr:hypothetical protein Ddc_06402 [Ditylenchus destructor]
MSYPAYSKEPYPNYPSYPQEQYSGGKYYVDYDDRPRKRHSNWLTVLLALCCGCCIGQACDDCGGNDCFCCCLPIPMCRF